MISKLDLKDLKQNSKVSRKRFGKVSTYIVVNRTTGGTHFWVRDTQYGNDSFYDENFDLTTPNWFIRDFY